MNRFATLLRFAVILAVAIGCGMLARLIPSPYHEYGSMSASRIHQTSAPDSTREKTENVEPKFRGVDVDANRLLYASLLS